ncbi:NAD(P)-binding protein [Calocera viscosa TUFC12733]|uniref:NAD(P)-binding protein n=1 Tax=Calocera viscosa (strain TUFC12733) TaxID=1330018 RepID=A0A167KLL1_CALVF|nr:NAD(P)-binding protein [Calocera viscosa TUFC12733]
MSQKLVVVAGATGQQGGSVVDALLAHGGYAVRGLTRNTSSPASQALTGRGVEMVSASLMDKSSLVSAFKGAYAVYGVTIPMTEDSETDMGKNMVDACLANHVPLFIWSSLPDPSEVGNGEGMKIRLMAEKAAVDKYIKVVGQPTVTFWTGFFTENMLGQKQLIRAPGSDGNTWEIHFPVLESHDRQPSSYITKDVGLAVAAVVDHWEDPVYKERLTKEPIILCSYVITGDEMVKTVARITGKEIKYHIRAVSDDPAIAATLKSFAEYWCRREIPAPVLKELGVQFHTLDEFVREKVVPFMSVQESSS